MIFIECKSLFFFILYIFSFVSINFINHEESKENKYDKDYLYIFLISLIPFINIMTSSFMILDYLGKDKSKLNLWLEKLMTRIFG